MKLNFVPERQLNREITPSVTSITISATGAVYFPASYINVYDLEGKFFRVFADIDKRTIGWMFVEGHTDLGTLDDCRQVKKSANGNYAFSIKIILKNMGIDNEQLPIKGLPVQIFKSSLYPADINYIQLPPKEVTATLNGKVFAPKNED